MNILNWEYDKKLMLLIGFLFVIRLFHITNPPIEVAHNWRQTTSLMVARNYYQLDHNILYPTIDECGNKRGVIGMEFPLIPYGAYIMSVPLGYDHWYGRLISLMIVSFGIWFFYKLLRLYFVTEHAFYATLAFAFSAMFHLGRKVMPDPSSLSLVLGGVYFGTLYLRGGAKWTGMLYLLFAGLGALVKIPFGLYLVLLAIPFFDGKLPYLRKGIFVVLSLFILSAVYWWYFVWNFHLMETFGQWYNAGRSIGEGLHELREHWKGVLEKFYFSAFHSYLFCAYAVVGLIIAIIKKQKLVIWTMLLLAPLMGVYMLKSGFLFAHHGYYALPIMPLLALLVGVFLISFDKRWAIALVMLAIIESVANQQHDFFIKDREYVKLQLTDIANQVSNSQDLFALASNENPNEFYFLNRKGWIVPNDHVVPSELEKLKSMGCRFLVIRKERLLETPLLEKVFENQDYLVFKM